MRGALGFAGLACIFAWGVIATFRPRAFYSYYEGFCSKRGIPNPYKGWADTRAFDAFIRVGGILVLAFLAVFAYGVLR
jgi:hypothetical protein